MKFVVEDEPDLTLPEDSIHRARLNSIELREFSWNDRKTGEAKTGQNLEWWWEITHTDLGEDYIGRKVKGECNPKMTNRDGNRMHQWSEALLNRQIPVGMTIDTDDLIGLEAEIVIGHRADKKDPSKKWEFVSDVAPADGAFNNDPPF
jgi:hypothetical protein